MLKNRLYLLTPATARDIITPEQTQLIIEYWAVWYRNKKDLRKLNEHVKKATM